MDIIEINGKQYTVVITQNEYGAEIGLWTGDDQVAAIVIDGDDVSVHETFVKYLNNASRQRASR
jgi:hypothetical protein